MFYEMLSKLLVNGNVENTIIGVINNKNIIILDKNNLKIISGKTNKFLGYCTIEQLIKYEHKITMQVTNIYLYFLLNIERINKYNGIVEETI